MKFTSPRLSLNSANRESIDLGESEPSSPVDYEKFKKYQEERVVQHQQSQETMSSCIYPTKQENKKKNYQRTIISKVELQSSSSGSNDDEDFDKEDEDDFSDMSEKKIVRKLDWRLMPLLTIIYLIAFLDRGNIDEAHQEGISKDLGLSQHDYSLSITVFFILYASIQIPSIYLIKRIKPSHLVIGTMILWSALMTLMGGLQNYKQLMAARSFLGILQAPLFPQVTFCLSMYYTRDEFLIRESIFFSAASIAGAFSGLLAIGINRLDGYGGIEGWRYLFIIEGGFSLLIAIAAYKYFPDFPKDANFLSEREKKYVQYRVAHDNNNDDDDFIQVNDNLLKRIPKIAEDDSNNDKYIIDVLKDWQFWGQLFLYIGTCVPLSGLSIFSPVIIENLGFDSTISHLLSIPIYLVAKIFSVIQAFVSSWVGVRSPFLLFNFISMLVGYVVCITGDPISNPGVVYAGTFIIAMGIYPAFPMVVVWNSNNLSGSYKRAIGVGLQIALGNFGSTFSASFYRAKDSPHFILGHSVEIGFIILGLVMVTILFLGYTFANLNKKRKLASGFYDLYSEEQLRQMGDKSPYFSYRL